MLEGISSILKMKKKWLLLPHTLLFGSCMFYVLCHLIFFTETSQLPFSAILLGFILASFSIAATNGGIGSYPLAILRRFQFLIFLKIRVLLWMDYVDFTNTNDHAFWGTVTAVFTILQQKDIQNKLRNSVFRFRLFS